MEEDVIKISELKESSDFSNLYTIGTVTNSDGTVESKKVSLANLLKVIASVTITQSTEDGEANEVVFSLLNGDTYTLNVLNGSKGSQGEKGATGDTGPTGSTGATGNGISSVDAVSTSTENGGESVYRITMTDGTTFDFSVYNGVVDADSTPTENSTKPVTSGGVYASLTTESSTRADADEEMGAEIERIGADEALKHDYTEEPLLCGQPKLLLGAGTPSASVVPVNWNQYDPDTETGYNWVGMPSAVGQRYLDCKDGGGEYIATEKDIENPCGNLVWRSASTGRIAG